MSVLNLTVKKFYTTLAILGCFLQATTACASPERNPAAQTITKGNTMVAVSPELKTPKKAPSPSSKPSLILDTKTIFDENSRPAIEGPRTGGGGNSCALAITQNTTTLMEYLNKSLYSEILQNSEDTVKVISVMKKTRFYLQDNLVKDGQVKDAMNFPAQGAIYISPKFCATELVEVSGRSMSLLLHEYLGLARINDRNYEVSGRFLELYADGKSKEVQTKVWLKKELKNELSGKKSCFRGAIAKEITEYEADDRNFMKDSDYRIEIMPIVYRGYGIFDGSCAVLDKSKREVEYGSPAAVYKLCSKENTTTYLARVPLTSGGRGSIGEDSLTFKVTRTDTITSLKPYDSEDGENYINQSFKTTFECTPHNLNWDE